MADIKDAAVQEALLDAYLDDIKAGSAAGEMVIAAAQHDEAETKTFVVDRTNADTVQVYNQHDGTTSKILVSMLSKQLRKRFPRVGEIPENLWGKRAFGMTPPQNVVAKAELLCWFHKDSEKRDIIATAGLGGRVCRKSNIPTELDVEMHVQRKHPQEYKILAASERKIQEASDRDLQRRQVDSMIALASTAAGAKAVSKPEKE
jgi:hypothetical protein